MKKFAYLLSFIVPQITSTYVTDDGAVYIQFLRGNTKKDAIVPLKDYESAVDRNRKIYGLFDKINGLC